MKLFKIKMDKNHPSVLRALVDAHDMHRNILNFFDTSRSESNVLYRINEITNDSIYVSANRDPVKRKSNGMEISFLKTYPSFKDGEHYRFSIFAQPCKKNGHLRIPLRSLEERVSWLYDRGKKNGFEIVSPLNTIEQKHHSITSKNKFNNHAIIGYYYSGVLKITDKEKFRKVLENGIGPCKSYGMGMLMIAR